MQQFFKKLIKSSFVKNILILMTGTGIAQFVSIAVLPILSHLFTPEEFGAVALFLAVANVIAAPAAGRYEPAIILPESDRESYNIFILCMAIICVVTVVTAIVCFSFATQITELMKLQDYEYFIYFLPLSVFLLATYNTLLAFFNRRKDYKEMAKSKIANNFSAAGINTGTGHLGANAGGLFLGSLSGQILSVSILFHHFRKIKKEENLQHNKEMIKQVATKNKNFPIFSAPMTLLNLFSVHIMTFFFTMFYSLKTVGIFSYAQRTLNYPLQFISKSFTSVFLQKLNESTEKKKIYSYSYFANLILAIIITFPVYFWGEELFSFAFGKEWTKAGVYAKAILPLIIFSYATRSVSNVFSVTLKNHIVLIWQVSYLAVAIGVIFIFQEHDILTMLNYYSIVGAAMYAILAFVGYRILK